MTEQTLSGSCLCGSVTYRVSGNAERFYHCHCSRCRKASGTGHCSNVLVSDASVSFEGNTSRVKTFKVPDAERFQTAFCGDCGAPLPRLNEAMRVAVIPAGSLDVDPPLNPQARIFWGSRSAWSCDESELPAFDTYPS